MKLTLLYLTCSLNLLFVTCFAQDDNSVSWQFHVNYLQQNQASVSITAKIKSGWHLYSQCLKEGGPIPTRFIFNSSDDYELSGLPKENGKATTYYDDTYEMDITWYSDEVVFVQKIILNKPETVITGSIEYMTCNDHQCVPHWKDFRIPVAIPQKT